MARSKLQTTTIGSFPKPDFLPIRDWFDAARSEGSMNSPKTTTNFTDYSETNADDEALYIRAAERIISLQIKAGVDIPTDGEVRRENYIHYHCRHLNGFDFQQLEHRVLRDGAYETDLPAIRSQIQHTGLAYSVRDFQAAQSVSSRPIKFTIPGPLTIMDTNADCFYQDRKRLAEDLAKTVNFEILALVEAGCKYVQVDEPLFARQVTDARSFGFEMLERCFHGVPKEVRKIVHICCGYPNFLDEEDYKKADPDSYHQLAHEMDQLNFDQISIEDAHCANNLKLLELFEKKTIIFGTIAIARSRLESVEEVTGRIKGALEHIDRDRLVIAPDCGLGFLSEELAAAKLDVMCQAAAQC